MLPVGVQITPAETYPADKNRTAHATNAIRAYRLGNSRVVIIFDLLSFFIYLWEIRLGGVQGDACRGNRSGYKLLACDVTREFDALVLVNGWPSDGLTYLTSSMRAINFL